MSVERIVAATDFSAAGARALRRAAQLAEAHRVPLHLATVVPGTWLAELRSWLAGAQVQASADALEARLQDAAWELEGSRAIEVRSHLLEGDARTELARFAAKLDAGVLVVGAHGRSLVGEIALGSTALALLERCTVPLLLVRNDAMHAYRKVLAGVAFEAAAREAILRAAALFPEADFTLAHVYEDPFAAEFFLGQASDAAEAYYRERARAQAEPQLEHFIAGLRTPGVRLQPRLIHGSPGLELARLAGQIGAELVVLGARRKPRRERAPLGSVAANVALIVQSDVLLVRHREPARRI
jgi:nucleotide-binding universal stress UspA family protein